MVGNQGIDVAKLALIRATAERLSSLSHDQVNLLFYEAGLMEVNPVAWDGDDFRLEPTDSDRRQIVVYQIRDLSLTDLTNLATAMHQLFDTGSPPALVTEPEPLVLFASHLTKQKQFVHQVAEVVGRWGISLFVAHDDIEPDAEWHAAIEAGLQRADAGVVFLLPGIAQSSWCDQEIGWLLGRGVPVRALKFEGQDPYGPLGKQQAHTVRVGATALEVAGVVLDWVEQRPVLAPHAQASFVSALASSRSFDTTNQVWGRLERLGGLTVAQVATVAAAVRDNDQVFGCEYRQPGKDKAWFPLVALRYLLQQPGIAGNETLLREVAQARGIEGEVFA